MRFFYSSIFAIIIISFVFVACGKPSAGHHYVNFEIKNASRNKLNWVEVNWPSGRVMSSGVLSSGISSTIVGFPWPEPPQSNIVLSFIEYGSQGNFIPGSGFDGNPKIYKINISLEEVNTKIGTGQVKDVIVRIRDIDKAEISCK